MLCLLLLAFAGGVASTEAPAYAGPIPVAVVTVSASAVPPGPGDDRSERSFERLNAIRRAAGTRPVGHSATLASSASQHAGYLSGQGRRSAASIHAETSGLDGFTGADPFVRMRALGYRPAYATEVIGDVGAAPTDVDCVDALMHTIYHAALLLSRVTEAGVAYGADRAAGLCVIDLGAPLTSPTAPQRATGEIVRYPWPGMTVESGAFRLASENPRPSPAELPGAVTGIPVLVGLRQAGAVPTSPGHPGIALQDFELLDDKGWPVAAVVLADAEITGPGVVADEALRGDFAVLVPRHPLPPGRYRVIVHATIGTDVVAPAPWIFVVATP
jgi:uncharacterized protein YkwD